MRRCNIGGCGWQAIAPSDGAAAEQYVRHVLEEHTTEADVDLPEGMVQVRAGEQGEWTIMTPEEARRFHAALHESPPDD